MTVRLLLATALVLPGSLLAAIVSEVRAESFGFDERDASACLQAALRSNAQRVIVGNTGKPWILRPVRLRGDLELVFEKGVEIQAMRGEFQTSCLFAASNAKNLVIRGEGNVLRMWKSDYQQPPYTKSEWRHCLSFHGCENVTIERLILRESGGDGIYLGTAGRAGCKDITIREVQCLNHHRQGISVIHAENLLIEDSSFSDTSGTAPMAGIDFEPNESWERVKNCVLRRCAFERNASAGVLFALGRMDAASEPVSITLEDCVVRGNARPLHLSPRNPAGVRGSITFTRCVFADSPKGSALIERKTLPGAAVTFDRCQFLRLATELPDSAPIAISCRQEQGDPLGGIAFLDCAVDDPVLRRPIVYDDIRGVRLKEITGRLTVTQGGETRIIDLTQALIDEWFPWTTDLRSYPKFDLHVAQLQPALPSADQFPAGFEGWLRGESTFAMVCGVAGQPQEVQIASRIIGKNPGTTPVPVRIVAPSGKVSALAAAPPGTVTRHAFTPTETGVHQVIIDAGKHMAACQGAGAPFSGVSPAGAFHFVGVTGELSFLVPAGVGEFALRVAGDGGLEQARVTVKNGRGEVVADEDGIARTRQIVLRGSETATPEIWSLRLLQPNDAVIEDVHVVLDGVPAVLASSPEALLVPSGTSQPTLSP